MAIVYVLFLDFETLSDTFVLATWPFYALAAVSVPVAWWLGMRVPARHRSALVVLVILPFWTSFLVRIFAWKVLLHPDGVIKAALVWLGLVPGTARLARFVWQATRARFGAPAAQPPR